MFRGTTTKRSFFKVIILRELNLKKRIFQQKFRKNEIVMIMFLHFFISNNFFFNLLIKKSYFIIHTYIH